MSDILESGTVDLKEVFRAANKELGKKAPGTRTVAIVTLEGSEVGIICAPDRGKAQVGELLFKLLEALLADAESENAAITRTVQ